MPAATTTLPSVYALARKRFPLCRRIMAHLIAFIALAWVTGSVPAQAQPLPSEAPARLPDGEVTRANGLTAWLIHPTTRYGHAVLGDAIEAGGFVVERAGRRLVYRLGEDAVFEDRRVRLADLDGDGVPEAIIVKSYLARGAALAVYRILPDRIEPLAESEAIGTRNRWMNPVGIAPFTGTSQPMIAVVVTPHLAGSLRLFALAGPTLREVARIDGYTNHIIGSRDLDLGRVAQSKSGPLIVLPTLDRRSLAAISFAGGSASVVGNWPVPARIEALRLQGDNRARLGTTAGEVVIDLRGGGDGAR
jgi:hypothetical protein